MNIKKILLINPPWQRLFDESYPLVPLGLAYIAGVLEQYGYNVVIYNADFDPTKDKIGIVSNVERVSKYNMYLSILNDANHPLWKEIMSVISQQSPDVIGISATTAKYGSALKVANLAKNFYQNVPIVFGGPHPTLLPEETIKDKNVDIVVRGEGEYTFLDIIENFDKLNKVLGITYKENERIIHNPTRPLIEKLDYLPFPARHLLLDKEKYHPKAFGDILASRGCPYKCIFCSCSKIWTNKVRFRSPESVVSEIRHLQEKFNTYQFTFQDDTFILNKKWVEHLCDLLKKVDSQWTAETRADSITDDLIKKMKVAGCEEVRIGVESGDEETLKRLRKGVTLAQIKSSNKILRNNKMRFSAFFMIGFPWETIKEINKTVSLMKELSPHEAILSIVTPYPGTELYEIMQSEGLIPNNVDWSTFFFQSPDMYLTKKLTKEETLKIVKDMVNLFEKHNKNKKRELWLSNPLYVIKKMTKGKYYNLRDLWALLR